MRFSLAKCQIRFSRHYEEKILDKIQEDKKKASAGSARNWAFAVHCLLDYAVSGNLSVSTHYFLSSF